MWRAYRDLGAEADPCVSSLNMSHSCMWLSVQCHDNQNSKKSQKKVGSILWIIHISQGLCQKPHGRWFIEPQLGPGIARPLLQASGTQAAAAAEYLFLGCQSYSLLYSSMLLSMMKMSSLDHQRSKRNRGPEGSSGAWEGGSVESGKWLPGPSDGCRKAKWSQLTGSYDRKENSPS